MWHRRLHLQKKLLGRSSQKSISAVNAGFPINPYIRQERKRARIAYLKNKKKMKKEKWGTRLLLSDAVPKFEAKRPLN
jgi:hypothetical protein